jgi:nitrite reductase/ring-hydroxylating ferredoxin subunit
MPKFVRVAAVNDLAPGKVMEVKANGQTLALCNVDGVFYALDNVCIHRGGPLGQGYVEGHKVECPWHGWQFDCRTGMLGNDPGMKVPTYEVKVEGEEVFVAV